MEQNRWEGFDISYKMFPTILLNLNISKDFSENVTRPNWQKYIQKTLHKLRKVF